MRSALAALAAIALASPIPAEDFPEIALPDSAPGRVYAEFLRQCANPGAEALKSWYDAALGQAAAERFSADKRVEATLPACRDKGGFAIGEILQDTPTALKLRLRGRAGGDWMLGGVTLDADGKIDRETLLTPTQPAEAALPKDLGDRAVSARLAERVAKAGAAHEFSGIAAIARGPELIATAGAGFADWQTKTPITPDTQFTLGSLGKMFTAAAVGQLVDRGKLSFDDTVGRIFPDYPNKTVRDKVTLGMLMSHTSGMGDFLEKRTPAMMKNGIRRAAELMPLYDKDEPAFEPGSRWAYSNAGLALMGAIVEKRAGMSYADYIRRHVFAPAGMTRSDPNNIPHRPNSLVVPYTRTRLDGSPLPDWREAERDIGSPAGGAISTARDLARFADALRSGKLFSRETFDRMAANHQPGGRPGEGYGYAMVLREIYGTRIVGHGGGFPGVNTELTFLPDGAYTVVVLANQDYPAADLIEGATIGDVVEKAKT
jgi:CubicO group peptidase (beta-lactamase class C family)